MRFQILIFLAVAVLLSAGSVQGAQKVVPKASGTITTDLENVGEKVGPGDKVIFSVAEDPVVGAPTEVLVDSKWNLRFLVCRGFSEEVVVNAENKTLPQLQKELKEKLDAKFYQNATVTLTVGAQALQPGKITITGPVRNYFVQLVPGERRKLLDAILQAGPSEFANLKRVKLMRIDPKTGKNSEEIINVEAIKKDPTKDIMVKDGDRLDIPEKNFLIQ
jgi:protein involved in polysaccharide export with SLBB domain